VFISLAHGAKHTAEISRRAAGSDKAKVKLSPRWRSFHAAQSFSVFFPVSLAGAPAVPDLDFAFAFGALDS
jgi:hypothetical protein